MKDFVFVTGNMHKVKWLEKFLGSSFDHHKLDLDEIQSPDSKTVLKHKVEQAYHKLQRPVLVDDVSLVFHALGDMPGTFIKFFVEGTGLEAMCRMLDGFDDRSATATTSYCYYDGKEMSFFEGMVHGRVADHPEGEGGHGWDSLFIADGQSKTRGSMDDAEYASTPNPRGLAVEKLKKFLEEAE